MSKGLLQVKVYISDPDGGEHEDRRFRGAYCLHNHGDHNYGGSTHLTNVSLLLPN
jgi:hypothetical protein